ncbi:MAG: tol-pal system protein YbgF [Pontibacterium sp.]
MALVQKKALLLPALFFSAGAEAASPQVIEIKATPSGQAPSAQFVGRSSQSNSELFMIVEQLQDEVRTLRGQLEQQTYRLKKMERQQLDRYRDLDRRLSALRNQPPAVAPAVQPTLPSAQMPAGPSKIPAVSAESSGSAKVASPEKAEKSTFKPIIAKTPAPAAAPARVNNGISDAKAYRDAFALVRARDFTAAIVAFKAFVRDYPGSVRVANAHYWLGEIYHAEQQLEPARESFSLVLGRFSNHPKAAHAAYKLGVIYSELGDKTRSREYLDYVIKNHPKSNVAPLAQEFKQQ